MKTLFPENGHNSKFRSHVLKTGHCALDPLDQLQKQIGVTPRPTV